VAIITVGLLQNWSLRTDNQIDS